MKLCSLWHNRTGVVAMPAKAEKRISIATSRISRTQSRRFFKDAIEPLEADEWLNTLEQKFRLLRVTEELKVEYAAHQLEGKAGVWWSHYRTSLPANAVVTWD